MLKKALITTAFMFMAVFTANAEEATPAITPETETEAVVPAVAEILVHAELTTEVQVIKKEDSNSTESAEPVTKIEEETLAACDCTKKNCNCKSKNDELAGCGCNKKKKNDSPLSDESTKDEPTYVCECDQEENDQPTYACFLDDKADDEPKLV